MKRHVLIPSLVLVASFLQVNASPPAKSTVDDQELDLVVTLDGAHHTFKVRADMKLDEVRSLLATKASGEEKILFEDDFVVDESIRFDLRCLAAYEQTVSEFIGAHPGKVGESSESEVFTTWLNGEKNQKIRAYTPKGLREESKRRQKRIGEGIKELAAALKECGIDNRDKLDAEYAKELKGVFDQVRFSADDNQSPQLIQGAISSNEGQELNRGKTNPYLLGLGGVAVGAASMYFVNRVLGGPRRAQINDLEAQEAVV